MSDRIAVMNHGRYEQLGDPESLYERPDDAVRGRLPRRQQPAARDASTGDRRPYATVRLGDDTARPGRRRPLVDGTPTVERRRPAREDPAARPTDAMPGGHNRLTGTVARRVVPGRQHPVHRGDAAAAHASRSTSRTSSGATRSELWAPGEDVLLDVVAGPHVRRRGRRRATATAERPRQLTPRRPPTRRRPDDRPTEPRPAGSPGGASCRARRWPASPRSSRPARAGGGSTRRPPSAPPAPRRPAAPAAPASATAPSHDARPGRSSSPTGTPTSTSRTTDDRPPADARGVQGASTASRSSTPNAEIEDNETFMATIRPQLQAGVDTGWDLIVLTDWMAARVVEAGWAEKIDPANVPDGARERPRRVQGPAVGPDIELPLPVAVGRDRRRLQRQVRPAAI